MKELQKINTKIAGVEKKSRDSQRNLAKAIKQIDEAVPSISVERNCLLLIKKESVERSLQNVYSTMKDHLISCVNGVKSLNGFLQEELDLIKMIVTIEADVYELLDKTQSQNMDSYEDLEKHLAKSLNDVSEEFKKRLLTTIRKQITIQEKLSKCDSETADAQLKIIELQDRITKVRNELTSELEILNKRINAIHKEINTEIEDCIKRCDDENRKVRESVEKKAKEIKTSVDAQLIKFKDDNQKERRDIIQKLNSTKSDILPI